MFKHEFFDKVELIQNNTDYGRYYSDENGNGFLSVTNFLGLISNNDYLEKWKKRVGEKEANRISGSARTRGTSIHNACEKFLLNEPNYIKGEMPINIETFNKFKPVLEKNITKIYGLEHKLYSKELLLAGTADVICDWLNEPTIVDFKTSKRTKEPKDILNYFYQTTIYAIMIKELFDLDIKQAVVIMSVDHEPKPQIFKYRIDALEEHVRNFILKKKPLIKNIVKLLKNNQNIDSLLSNKM